MAPVDERCHSAGPVALDRWVLDAVLESRSVNAPLHQDACKAIREAIARVEEKGREDLAAARAEGADGAFEIAAEQCAREAAIWKDDHTTRGKGIRQGARLCESRIRARASDRLVAVSVDDLRHELKLCKCDRPHGPLDSWPEVHLDAVDRIRAAEMGKR